MSQLQILPFHEHEQMATRQNKTRINKKIKIWVERRDIRVQRAARACNLHECTYLGM